MSGEDSSTTFLHCFTTCYYLLLLFTTVLLHCNTFYYRFTTFTTFYYMFIDLYYLLLLFTTDIINIHIYVCIRTYILFVFHFFCFKSLLFNTF